MSTLFLNIFTLLAVTQSVDNLFHSFINLCENECFQYPIYIDEEQQMMMNLTPLQSEVSVGTYKFARPLIIVACATQEKYVVYISCSQCPKGVQQHNKGYYCPLHKWQRAPVYRYKLRVLLQDWIGTEIWVSLFNEVAAKLLGFAANSYVAMTSDEDRSAALSVLSGPV